MSDLFCKAKKLIEEDGWHQGAWGDVEVNERTSMSVRVTVPNRLTPNGTPVTVPKYQGPVCLHGALYASLEANKMKVPSPAFALDSGVTSQELKEARAASQLLYGYGYDYLWNDTVGRTKEQVLEVLEMACEGKLVHRDLKKPVV
jgi:hypothetical protein